LHPLSIAFLRQGTYPPSDITIEQTLDPGPNYFRYIASYRSEGLQIFTYMTVPFGEKPESGWPVVVFNHGYIPPTQYRSTERYVAYVDAFAKRGYIVFRSDYRGHGDSGGNPRGAYGAPDYTIDVLNAVSALKNYADADPNRIGMWGHSMGGFITLRSMVTLADIRAGVIWGGVVGSYPDLFSRWRGPGTSDEDVPPQARRNREMVFAVYGDPEENPEFWDSISANTFLGDLSGPVQLHHGTADQSVPFAFSETLNEQIRAVGKPVEFYSYEGDNHNISIAFSLAMQRSIAFFDQHVKAYTGP
jgi:dipeptidyl aminopeptidase/acylaminoacyl peptidase